MSILKYRAFLATVENQSLTKAAEQLGYTQPGVSHMLSSLEQELGFPLLLRTKSGITPTENAMQIQYYMRQIVSAENTLQEIAHNICGLESGSLRIGSFSSTSSKWLPAIISTFLSRHLSIDIQILEGIHGELWDWLLNGTIDLALTSEPIPDNFSFIPLWQDPLLAVLSKKHPLADRDTIPPQELAESPFIVPSVGADETVWQVMNAENLSPSIKFRIKGDMVTLAMIGQNLGVSIIPELALANVPESIVMKPLSGHYFRTLGICIRSLEHISPAAKEFISLTRHFIEHAWKSARDDNG